MDFNQKIHGIKTLREQGKVLEAIALLNEMQRELLVGLIDKVQDTGLCKSCGKDGDFLDQEGICDFCYTASNNLGQGNASVSKEEMGGERFDDLMKKIEEPNG